MNKDQSKIPHYSNVTKSLSREDYSRRKVNLLFDINITDKNLNNYFYSEHQQYLYDTIKELHRKGLGYRKISKWFNENNILTIKGKEFKPNHVSSILKKGKIRYERNTRTFKPKIENIRFIC